MEESGKNRPCAAPHQGRVGPRMGAMSTGPTSTPGHRAKAHSVGRQPDSREGESTRSWQRTQRRAKCTKYNRNMTWNMLLYNMLNFMSYTDDCIFETR